jgi:spore coat protein U-like protein
MKKTFIPIALVFTLIAVAPAAFAATQGGTLTVTAGVSANCTIGAATLAFGTYDPVVTNATADLDKETTMSVSCTKGVNAHITAAAGGTINGGAGNNLNYLLFSNSLRTTDFTGTGFAMSFAAGKAAQDLTIYGRIAGGQDVSAASFTGQTTVTVNF